MRLTGLRLLLIASIITVLTGCGSALTIPGGPTGPNTHTAGFGFFADPGWVELAPSSSMRIAQYELPGADLNFDDDDASLVVYHFGSGGAGNVQANIDRWVGQFEVLETDASHGLSFSDRTVRGLAVHEIDVSGRYVAETAPGSGERVDNPGYRMLAAIVLTDNGPYYVKLVGPADTVAIWESSYERMIASIDPNAASTTGGDEAAAHP